MMKRIFALSVLATICLNANAVQRVYVMQDAYDTETGIPAEPSKEYIEFVEKSGTPMSFSEWFNAPTALPSCLGAKDTLTEYGITPVVAYLGNFAANPTGGRETGAANSSSVHMGLGVDLKKLTGIDALSRWSLGNTWVWRFGDSLTRDKLGNTFNVQQNFGSQTMQMQSLFAVYHNPEFADDYKLLFKIGRFAAGDNFMSKPIYWLYQNNAFDGNPVGVFNQGRFSAYPAGTWAAFAQITDRSGRYFKAGVYQINSERAENMHGLDWSFSTADGINANWEIGWDINHDASAKNPANVSAGFVAEWYNAPYVDGSGRTKSFNCTFYLQADYMIWNLGEVKGDKSYYIKRAEDKYRDLRGLIVWACVQYAPDDEIAKMPIFFDCGLLFNAPLASRPDDVICFGAAWGKFSDKYSGDTRNSHEIVLELNYKAQINQFMSVQPNIQFVLNPAGGRYGDALVLGMQYGMAF